MKDKNSLNFNGESDYIEVDKNWEGWDFRTSDFTIDFYPKPPENWKGENETK